MANGMTRQYIGARYVPVFADPVEWDDDRTYEPLMMVQHQGETYMTKQYVPVGIPLPTVSEGQESNDYWVHMSNWNAQVEGYREEVLRYADEVQTFDGRIDTLEDDLPTSSFDSTNTVAAAISAISDVLPASAFDTTNTVNAAITGEETEREAQDDIRPIVFDTVADMKSSEDLKAGMTCKTNGFRTSGDDGAAWYVISDSGTANEMDVIACGDLYATLVVTDTYATPEMFGAYADNANDDTAFIQQAINSGYPLMMNGTYLLVAGTTAPWHHTLTIPSNTIIDGSGTLNLAPNAYQNYDMMYLPVGTSNITIKNISLVGEATDHLGALGEWGCCIDVDGANNVILENLKLSNSWGDGILIGNLDNSTVHNGNKNVTVRNCLVYGNSRNNISICHGDGILVEGCTIHGAFRLSPKAGIDIEPDDDLVSPLREEVHNCRIVNCYFYDNDGYAISINDRDQDDVTNIVVENNLIEGQDNGIGITCSGSATRYYPHLISGNKLVNVKRGINGSQEGAAYAIGNEIKLDNGEYAISLAGSHANKISGNHISGSINSDSAFVIHIGAYGVVENNSVKLDNVAVNTGTLIKADIYALVKGNQLSCFSGILHSFVFLNGDSVQMLGNVARIGNYPICFANSAATYTPGSEVISFNDCSWVNGVYGQIGSLNAHANVWNGTYTA